MNQRIFSRDFIKAIMRSSELEYDQAFQINRRYIGEIIRSIIDAEIDRKKQNELKTDRRRSL